jgi:protein gp37
MAKTAIPYCDETWDLTIGCRKRSEGCANCWATRICHRMAAKGLDGFCTHEDRDRTDREPRFGRIQTTPDGKDWLDTYTVNLLHWNLEKPMHWGRPRFVFVNSKSDLFDNRVPFEFIGQVFTRMAASPKHRFMVLTKEPGRMADFVDWYRKQPVPCWALSRGQDWYESAFGHVILMASVEGPKHLARIETLLAIPSAMWGVSIEPLIDPIGDGLLKYLAYIQCSNCGWLGFGDNDTPEGGLAKEYDGPDDVDGNWQCPNCGASEDGCVHDYSVVHNPFGADPRLNWVVIGCEKLHGGRAGRWAGDSPDAWWGAARMIVEQCRAAGVAIWVKQGPKVVTKGGRSRVVVTTDPKDFPVACRWQQRWWDAAR